MANLFWPGGERRGDQFTEAAFLEAMVAVEAAWLQVLVEADIAPAEAADDLIGLVTPDDIGMIATEAEASGTPVLALVGLLRERVAGRSPLAATWLHRGLTSQDVVDTAIMTMLRETAYRVREETGQQVVRLIELIEEHRDTLMVARTLTQHAVPMTFGLKAAHWLRSLVDVLDRPGDHLFTVQLGGAGGTLAASTELAASTGVADPARAAVDMIDRMAALVGLAATPPWHTSRGRVTRLGDVVVLLTDAWGRLANDIMVMSRPEIGELSEGTPGASSTMPHKRNPVLASQVRRAAIVAPGMAASLHVAAMDSIDERAGGAWQAEWGMLADLERVGVVAASQTTELLGGLEVHVDRMAANLQASLPGILSEQGSMAELVGRPAVTDPASYLGATSIFIDEELERARAYLTTYGVIA